MRTEAYELKWDVVASALGASSKQALYGLAQELDKMTRERWISKAPLPVLSLLSGFVSYSSPDYKAWAVVWDVLGHGAYATTTTRQSKAAIALILLWWMFVEYLVAFANLLTNVGGALFVVDGAGKIGWAFLRGLVTSRSARAWGDAPRGRRNGELSEWQSRYSCARISPYHKTQVVLSKLVLQAVTAEMENADGELAVFKHGNAAPEMDVWLQGTRKAFDQKVATMPPPDKDRANKHDLLLLRPKSTTCNMLLRRISSPC